MYSTQHLEIPSKITMERMYSTSSTLNRDSNMPGIQSQKKENMFQYLYNTFNTFVWEHFSKVPGSFIANYNNPLSVTVVQNEGIISHEFFKSLTNRKEQLTRDSMFVHDTQSKEPPNIFERIHCGTFDDKIPHMPGFLNNNIKEDLKFDSNCKDANSVKDTSRSDTRQLVTSKGHISVEDNKLKNNQTSMSFSCNGRGIENIEEKIVSICSDIFNETTLTEQSCNLDTNKKSTIVDEEVCNNSGNEKLPVNDESSFVLIESSTIQEEVNTNRQQAISNLLTNVWERVVNGVTDKFYCRTESFEPSVTMKRSISPKQRRKLNTVAKGRGRGRARSQLRRSGVSQTRHRKERTKHDLVVDIQDDFDSWQELEIYETVQCNQSVDCCSVDENNIDIPDAPEFIIHETVHPMTFTIADIKPRNRKPKIRKVHDQDVISSRVRYLPESTVDANGFYQEHAEKKYDSNRNTFRPRLLSESSVDSEDSYCIVFETNSGSNWKSDLDNDEVSDDGLSSDDEGRYTSEDDEDDDDDDDDDEDESESEASMQKVKFNLKPIVHVMVQWDYAYRAARRGPWEEMARDRERFRGRINCIERVLNPILTKQHRTHIWHERFAHTE